ncbi:MAG: glycine zipper 2TM domain-containing protein [Steroidobacteraceae bacterium]
MNNKILMGLGAAVLALAAQTAAAGGRWNDGYGARPGYGQEYARVVRVEPVVQRYRYDVPVQRCWDEVRYHDAYVPAHADRTGATIVGGVAGALIGSQFGSGGDRTAATVAGAAIGATIGNQVARNNSGGYYVEPRGRAVQRCGTVRDTRYDERIVAYRVTYDWRGHRQVTQLPYRPGSYLRVGVDVYPLR